MIPNLRDRVSNPREAVKINLDLGTFSESLPLLKQGRIIFDLKDAEGNRLAYFEKDNLIVYDAGIIGARLFRDSLDPSAVQSNGLTMLAVGTGATGPILSPDAPQPTQRKLFTELARKAFSTTQFRNEAGVAVAYPTHIVDFTTTFTGAEANGALNEMSLMYTVDLNPAVTNPLPAAAGGPGTGNPYDATFDVTGYDLLCNHLTFGVVVKPVGAILSLTWRLTF